MNYYNKYFYYASIFVIVVTVIMWFVPTGYKYSLSDFVKNRVLDALFILYSVYYIIGYQKK